MAVTPRRSCPVAVTRMLPAFALGEALRCQHMLHVRGADPLRERGEGAVGGRVRIAADDGHARQRCALFWPDHMHDALTRVRHLELANAKATAIVVQRKHLRAGDLVLDARDAGGAVGGGQVVVWRREVGVKPPRHPPGQLQSLECLGRGDLVQEMPVDVEQRHAVVALGNGVSIPNLVVESLSGHAA